MGKRNRGGFYAVLVGRTRGIFRSWAEAEASVSGFQGARHKKFSTEEEAEAYLSEGSDGVAHVQQHQAMPSRPQYSTHQPPPAKKRKVDIQAIPPGFEDAIRVYTDGSGLNNGSANCRAGSGAWWENRDYESISVRVPGPVQTNNRGELYAMVRVLEVDPSPTTKLHILSDSSYSIKSLTVWADGWKRRGWKSAQGKAVQNLDLIQYALSLIEARPAPVHLSYVKAHVGIVGNENADRLALAGAALPDVPARTYKLKPAPPTTDPTRLTVDGIDKSMLLTDEEMQQMIDEKPGLSQKAASKYIEDPIDDDMLWDDEELARELLE